VALCLRRLVLNAATSFEDFPGMAIRLACEFCNNSEKLDRAT